MNNAIRILSALSNMILVLTGIVTASMMALITKNSDTFTTGTAVGLFAAGLLIAAIASVLSIFLFTLEYAFARKNWTSNTLKSLKWSHSLSFIGFMVSTVVFNVRA